MKLAALTNSFNRRSLLDDCSHGIAQMATLLGESFSWIVFDAGSTDGSLEFIEEFRLKNPEIAVHLIVPSPGEDRSFAAGCNQAAHEAVTLYPELEWFLFFETDNQLKDVEVIGEGIRHLTRHPELGALGFTVSVLSGESGSYGIRFPGPLSFLLGQQLTARLGLDRPRERWQHDGKVRWTEADVAFTSPLLVRCVSWAAVSGMDAATFPFTDSDLDLCWRLRQAGFLTAVMEAEGVIHDNQGTASGWSARRVLWFHQSRLRLMECFHPGCSLWLKPLLALRHVVEIMILGLVSCFHSPARISLAVRWKLLSSVFRGYSSNP